MKLYLSCFLLFPFLFAFYNSDFVKTNLNSGKIQPVKFRQNEKYPFWGPYHKTSISEIKPANWIKFFKGDKDLIIINPGQ